MNAYSHKTTTINKMFNIWTSPQMSSCPFTYYLPHTWAWQALICFLLLSFWFFEKFCTCSHKQCRFHFIWLLWFSIILSRFMHVADCVNSSFLFVGWYSTVWVYYNLFTQSSVEGEFVLFPTLFYFE